MDQLITPTISNLPPEILSSIFLFNTSVDTFSTPGHVKLLQDTARYTSQVCRRWRFILLENPIIWSRVIDFTRGSHLWTEEFLKRAADSPLILVSRYRSLSSDVLAKELEHVSRFGRYGGKFTAGTWPLLLDKFHQPAPCLEELSLQGRVDGQFKLPATIFSGNAPRLRRLWLEFCSFDEALPYLPQLTYLRVWELTFPPKKWLDVLPSMPLLTVLELRGVATGTGPHAAIHLPNLTRITMTASLRESSVFLSCLVLPATCDMIVGARDACPGAELDITAGIIMKKLQFYFNESTQSDPCLRLCFATRSFVISNLLISHTGAELKTNTPYIYFDVSWTTLEHGLLSILPHISSAFAVLLNQVTFLELSLNHSLAPKVHSAIANVLRQANNVTSLVRLDWTSAKILLRLERLTATQNEDNVIFASLRSIHISKSLMGPMYTLSAKALEHFVDFIRYRICISAPIEEFYYTRSPSVSWDIDEVEYLKRAGILWRERDWQGAPTEDGEHMWF